MNFAHPETHIDIFPVNPGDVVVDLGAGSGAYTKAIAKKVTSRGIVYAVDLNRDLLARLKKDALDEHLSNIDTLWGDIEKENGVQLTSHIADAILLCNVLFMVEDKEELLKEIQRLLKPQGKVLVVEWSDSHGGIGPHQDHVFDEKSAQDLFIKHGFTISHTNDDASYHYRFVATHTI